MALTWFVVLSICGNSRMKVLWNPSAKINSNSPRLGSWSGTGKVTSSVPRSLRMDGAVPCPVPPPTRPFSLTSRKANSVKSRRQYLNARPASHGRILTLPPNCSRESHSRAFPPPRKCFAATKGGRYVWRWYQDAHVASSGRVFRLPSDATEFIPRPRRKYG